MILATDRAKRYARNHLVEGLQSLRHPRLAPAGNDPGCSLSPRCCASVRRLRMALVSGTGLQPETLSVAPGTGSLRLRGDLHFLGWTISLRAWQSIHRAKDPGRPHPTGQAYCETRKDVRVHRHGKIETKRPLHPWSDCGHAISVLKHREGFHSMITTWTLMPNDVQPSRAQLICILRQCSPFRCSESHVQYFLSST